MKFPPSKETQAQIAVMLLAFLGPAILYSLWPSLGPSIASYWWPTVEGKVITLFVQPKKNDKGRMRYFGRASYSYSVDGKQYTSELTCFGDNPRAGEEEAIDDLAAFRPGKIVRVYYNPRDPSVGVIIPGMFVHQMAASIMLLAMSVIGFVVCIRTLLRWLANRKTVPPHILSKFT